MKWVELTQHWHLSLSSLYSRPFRSLGIHVSSETEPSNLENIWSFPFPLWLVSLENS